MYGFGIVLLIDTQIIKQDCKNVKILFQTPPLVPFSDWTRLNEKKKEHGDYLLNVSTVESSRGHWKGEIISDSLRLVSQGPPV